MATQPQTEQIQKTEYFVQLLPDTITHKGLEAVCCSTGELTRLSVNIKDSFFTISHISDTQHTRVLFHMSHSKWLYRDPGVLIVTSVFQAVSVNLPGELRSSHSLLMLSQSRRLAPRSIQNALLGVCLFLNQEERRVGCGKSEESMCVLGIHRQVLHQVANPWQSLTFGRSFMW